MNITFFFPSDFCTEYIMIADAPTTMRISKVMTSKEASIKKEGVQTKPPKKAGNHSLSSTTYNVPFEFLESGRRNQVMVCEGQKYIQNNKYGDKIYWKCSRWHDKCKARAITLQSQPDCIIRRNEHNHEDNLQESEVREDKIG